MNDELDRIRSLRGDAPVPSDDWVQDTRAELLAMAAEAEQERRAAAAPGPWARLRGWLAALVAGRRPAVAAGAVALVTAVTLGVVLTTNGAEDPTGPIAGPTTPPRATTSPAQATPSAQPDGGIVLASSCEGGNGTYTVGYPEGWHTNAGDVAEPCERFDDQPVELEAQTGGTPEQPVVVSVLAVGFDRAGDPSPAERETSRTETTVAGRDAVVVEWTSTGEGALPEGMRSYRYLIDLEDRTLMIAAHDLGDGSFDTHVEVVDAMAESIEVTLP